MIGSAKAAFLFVLLQASPLQDARLGWIPNPRTTRAGWIADPAGHLAQTTVVQLDAIISALERETTAEIAVVVADSLDGLEPGPAALLLHRRWGVGKRDRDNGLLVLWSPALRKTFVSVGNGLEGVLPDATVGRIQDQEMIPAFRRGEFDAGLIATVSALAAAARGEKYIGPRRAHIDRPARTDEAESKVFGAGTILFIAVWSIFPLLLIGTLVLYVIRRYHPRKCPKGHWMRRLSEKEDDTRLGAAQQLEERLESVDYDVYLCRRCDTTIVIPHLKDSKYKKCPKCAMLTCEERQLTNMQPTYEETGTGVMRRRCKNCEFADEKPIIIPKKVVHTSSGSGSGGGGWRSSSGGSSSGGSSSGGSSFGGGSSGGGGAGRSY